MLLAAFFLAVSIGLIAFLAIRFLGPGGLLEKEKQLKKRLLPNNPSLAVSSIIPDLIKKNNLGNIKIFKPFLDSRAPAEKLLILLKTARLKISVSTYFLICFTGGVTSFFIMHYALNFQTAESLPIAFGLCFAPFVYLKFMRAQYLKKFSEQLPNALSIISASIKVGHGLEAAMGTIAKTAPYPLSDEFATVQAEMKLGLSLQEALSNLYDRIKGPELKILITGITINQQLGGNLSELLGNLERTIRERFQLMREIKSLSAQGIMSAAVLFCIPFLILLILMKNDSKLMIDFFTSPGGRVGIGFCVLSQGIAFVWIRNIVRLKD